MNVLMRKKKRYSERKKTSNQEEKPELKPELAANIIALQKSIGYSNDIVVRMLAVGKGQKLDVAVIYIDGMVDKMMVNDYILRALTLGLPEEKTETDALDLFHLIKDQALTIGQVKVITDFRQAITSVLSGESLLLIDGCNQLISCSTQGWEARSVEEPQSQTVVRGPKEGFTENLRTNVSLVRRKIKSPNLWLEMRTIGRVTQTNIGIIYLKGIADDQVVQEVRARLDRIDTDSILESGYIEEFIQDQTFTPFPTIYNSERPDTIAAGILEGQVAIMIDGTPFVLLAPTTFIKFFQASEDYYHRWDISTFLRILRIASFTLSLLLPSIYIAITTYHQEMLPTTLLISLAAQREGVPFPAFVEALMMELIFEVLREAGVRMPRAAF